MAKKDVHMFHVLSMGFATGIFVALAVLFLGLLNLTGWGSSVVSLVGDVYLGYESTFVGIITGMVWALVDGFIGGVIFAWLYNLLAKKFN